MKVSDNIKGEKTTSRQAPLPHGRLGSSEKPLNVASAPQRGANSPFATEGRGLGVGLFIPIIRIRAAAVASGVVTARVDGARAATLVATSVSSRGSRSSRV